jgi:hypothetical protein
VGNLFTEHPIKSNHIIFFLTGVKVIFNLKSTLYICKLNEANFHGNLTPPFIYYIYIYIYIYICERIFNLLLFYIKKSERNQVFFKQMRSK